MSKPYQIEIGWEGSIFDDIVMSHLMNWIPLSKSNWLLNYYLIFLLPYVFLKTHLTYHGFWRWYTIQGLDSILLLNWHSRPNHLLGNLVLCNLFHNIVGGSKEIFRRKTLFLKELLPHRIWHSGRYGMIMSKNIRSLCT